MNLTAENNRKIQEFFIQYSNKSLWQIETQVEKLIKDLVKEAVNQELDNILIGVNARKLN